MPSAIVNADAIRRIPVPEEKRTPDKDQAAVWIEDSWPATLTEIAEKSGYSRQHIKNTLVDYFEEADESHASREIPDDDTDALGVDSPVVRALLIGYRLGWRDRGAGKDGDAAPEGDISEVLGKLTN